MQTNVSNIIFHQDIAWLSPRAASRLVRLVQPENLPHPPRNLGQTERFLSQPKDQSAEKSDENANKYEWSVTVEHHFDEQIVVEGKTMT